MGYIEGVIIGELVSTTNLQQIEFGGRYPAASLPASGVSKVRSAGLLPANCWTTAVKLLDNYWTTAGQLLDNCWTNCRKGWQNSGREINKYVAFSPVITIFGKLVCCCVCVQVRIEIPTLYIWSKFVD